MQSATKILDDEVEKSNVIIPVGAAAPHARNPGHGAAGAPGLGTGLVTRVHIHAVRLALVLGDLVVDGGHDVGPHRGAEDGGQADRRAGAGVLVIIDSDQRAGRRQRHLCNSIRN